MRKNIIIPIEIAWNENLNASDKILFGFLYGNLDDKCCDGTNLNFSQYLNMSVTTIAKSLKKLESEDLLEIFPLEEYGHYAKRIYIKEIYGNKYSI